MKCCLCYYGKNKENGGKVLGNWPLKSLETGGAVGVVVPDQAEQTTLGDVVLPDQHAQSHQGQIRPGKAIIKMLSGNCTRFEALQVYPIVEFRQV